MNIVDTHLHADNNHFEPIEVALFQMERNGVSQAVLIQGGGNLDNNYLLECMRCFPNKFVVVGAVDMDTPAPEQLLEFWVGKGIKGIRLGCETRSKGNDPLAIWRKASELGIVVSVPGRVEQFASDSFKEIVESMSTLTIVMEHLGNIPDPEGPRPGPEIEPPYRMSRKMFELSRYPNTYIKVGGFGEFCTGHFPYEKIPPLFQMAYDAFGARRMMWGSDFPPVSFREGYRNALEFPLNNISFKTDLDKEWIFGKTAEYVWKFAK